MPRNNRPGHRRLELSLPADHPLWSLPPRSRAGYARALLDLGLAAERKLAEIEEKLDRALAALEAKAEARDAGAKRASEGAPDGGNEARRPRGGTKVDVASFLAAFDE